MPAGNSVIQRMNFHCVLFARPCAKTTVLVGPLSELLLEHSRVFKNAIKLGRRWRSALV